MASGESRTSSSHTRSVRTCTECKQAKVHPKAASSTEYIANYHWNSSAAIPKSTFQILAQDASQDNCFAMWTRLSRERQPESKTPGRFVEDALMYHSRRIEAMSREIQELRSQREGENATLSPETGGSTSLASEPSSGLSTEDNFDLEEATVVLNGLLVESHLAIDALKVYVCATTKSCIVCSPLVALRSCSVPSYRFLSPSPSVICTIRSPFCSGLLSLSSLHTYQTVLIKSYSPASMSLTSNCLEKGL